MPPPRPTRPRPEAPAARARPARRPPLLPVVVGVIALLAVIAVVASGGGDGDGGADDGQAAGVEETRPVSVTGEALTKYGGDHDDAEGTAAPRLEGARFDGTPLTIGADGRAKVLVFLAHWCPHCQREVPVLVDWLAANGAPDGVDLYGIAASTTPDRPNYPPSAWLAREGWTVTTLADSADSVAGQAFGLTAFPYFVALDRENHVRARTSGELTVEQWEALLEEAAAGAGASTAQP